MGKTYRSRSARRGFMRRRDADYHRTQHRVHSYKYIGYITLAVVFILLMLCICGAPFV